MSIVDVTSAEFAERVYACVVGKILGVYLGRPVEGWPYARVRAEFGQITRFPALELGEPLIVADDDISASFLFPRVVEDDVAAVSLAGISDNWLNYIIEGKSVLWWGGLGRSTEHTALVNLKHGARAPESGSTASNGSTLAEQIGALIFNDNFSLLYPGSPDEAAEASRVAASVSHDGAALEAVAYMAALRAELFLDDDLRAVAGRSLSVVGDERVVRVVRRVLDLTDAHDDWRTVRDVVDAEFGYAVMPGPCHVLSNLGVILMALLMGHDVLECAGIAASAGFDSDSNAGVVGGTAALRYGLAGLRSASAHRQIMAERMLVVSAEGGECVTDATREASRLVDMAKVIRHGTRPTWHERPRFTFPWPGSLQGFTACPYVDSGEPHIEADAGLRVRVTKAGVAISTPTFLEPGDEKANFSTIASPTLVGGQQVILELSADSPTTVTPYVLVTTPDGVRTVTGEDATIPAGTASTLGWRVPDLGRDVAFRFGIQARSLGGEAELRIASIDWRGAPERFELQGVMQADIWDLDPVPLRAWVSAADNFEADYDLAIAVAQTRGRGTATTGTRDWTDYEVSAECRPSLHRAFGLIGRARGLRRYYAVRVTPTDAALICASDGEENILASVPVAPARDEVVTVALRFDGGRISAVVGGTTLSATDDTIHSGGAGLLVEEGSFAVDHFVVKALTS